MNASRTVDRMLASSIAFAASLSLIISLLRLLTHFGVMATGGHVLVIFMLLAIAHCPFWIFVAIRCVDAMHQLETTEFPLGRLPPLIILVMALGLSSIILAPLSIQSVLYAGLGSSTALAFFACGSMVKADLDGERPGTFPIDAMNTLGGFFGIVIARFTFAKSFAIKKVALRMPTAFAALLFIILTPIVLKLVLDRAPFGDVIDYSRPSEYPLVPPFRAREDVAPAPIVIIDKGPPYDPTPPLDPPTPFTRAH